MQQQTIFKTIMIGIGLIITVCIIIFVAFFIWQNKVRTDPVLISTEIINTVEEKIDLISIPKVLAADLSDRLIISAINVDATIESLGILANGEMATPKGPNNVSWYNLGPKPGEIGSSVIAGHYGWKNGIPAVFDNLNRLEIGDLINIQNDESEIITFIVREIQTFGEHEDATKVFISSDNIAHLNLITCGGVWDKIKKSYSSRLVIFTDRV